jgi:hypothetical protein
VPLAFRMACACGDTDLSAPAVPSRPGVQLALRAVRPAPGVLLVVPAPERPDDPAGSPAEPQPPPAPTSLAPCPDLPPDGLLERPTIAPVSAPVSRGHDTFSSPTPTGVSWHRGPGFHSRSSARGGPGKQSVASSSSATTPAASRGGASSAIAAPTAPLLSVAPVTPTAQTPAVTTPSRRLRVATAVTT